jgi:predicted dehydrogenase
MHNKIAGKVRIALVGAGGIAGAHIRGLQAHPDKLECVAMCDVSEANLKSRLQRLGANPPVFHDWRTMLEQMGGQIDAVDICLPHHLHAPAILDAAAAGKHILCEKPMCLTLAEADEIAAAVKKSGVTYMSAHNQLFLPVVREIKRRLDAGELGAVLWLRSQDCFVGNVESFRGKWRAQARTQGGGELIDTGYHPTYRLLHLAGAPVTGVRASMGRFRQPIEGEDTASVQVRFANGAIGEILTSWAFPQPHGTHQLHVIGERGQLFGSNNELYYRPAGYSEPARMTLPSVDDFAEELAHFAECLRSGARPIHSVEEGRQVLEVILRATEDAQGWQAYAPKLPA